MATAAADTPKDQSHPARSTQGLVALYDFREGSGDTIKNQTSAGSELDLKIDDLTTVQWATDTLTLTGNSRIQGAQNSVTLFRAMTWTGEVSIEVWIETATVDQKGPARIVTFSKNGSERNFTLGQDGSRIDVRFRTSSTTGNGIPSLAAAESSLTPQLTHVIYTRDRSGRAQVYLDGQLSAEDNIGGSLDTWNDGYELALGNEIGDERPWQGTYHRVALYNRALRPQEVAAHFQAGASGSIDETPAAVTKSHSARLFEENVAPIFAKHCIECHDPAKKKGDVDLSTRTAVFSEDSASSIIVPGDLVASVLWESVESDAMPKKRDPLSADEKDALKAWIESGAEWTHERIDPVVYLRGGGTSAEFSRRLTVNEYIATVEATLGVDVSTEARNILPPDVRADGFQNTAYNLHVDLKHVDAYAQLAEIAVSKLDVGTFVSTFAKDQGLDEKSTRRLVDRMGTWILRGPLDDHEIAHFTNIVPAVVSSGGDFEETVGYVVLAMIQSPRFLYRIENQRGDGAMWPANEYERASRLSYALWGSSPDSALMAAARKGELFAPEDLSAHVDRMLQDPRAIAHSKQFVYEWLDLGRMDDLRPSPELFPDWDSALGPAMREETLAFFEEVVWTQQRPMADLFNAQVTFLTPALAQHYGLDHVGEGLARFDLSAVPERGGLLTQGSLLTMGGDDASMVTRGLFVLNNILRGTVNDPPPGLDTTPVPSSPGQSQRVISEGRLKMEACSGCHEVFEPLAFGLEKFDGVGAYREADHFENPLREDGSVLVPGAASALPYATAADLMNVLAQSDRVQETIAWKLAQFSVGRSMGPRDVSTMNAILEESRRGGNTYSSLIKAIALSDLIQKTTTESYP